MSKNDMVNWHEKLISQPIFEQLEGEIRRTSQIANSRSNASSNPTALLIDQL
ncbi:MAG: hypothetical protein AB1522_00450 [Chloroflexota bacterium]